MADKLAVLDGVVMDVAEAQISVTDEGLLRGDGVFEVIRLYAGRPFGMQEHVARMARSAESLRLPFDADVVRADAEALLSQATPGRDAAARRHPRRAADRDRSRGCRPSRRRSRCRRSPTRRRACSTASSRSPTAANMLASRLAREQGADEALLVSPHGRVLEGPTTSFFYVLDGALYTPPLSDRILDSITRRALLAVTDASERVTTRDDLAEASEAFLASSLREVQPVRSIDGVALPQAPGPLSASAATAVREHIEAALSHAAG